MNRFDRPKDVLVEERTNTGTDMPNGGATDDVERLFQCLHRGLTKRFSPHCSRDKQCGQAPSNTIESYLDCFKRKSIFMPEKMSPNLKSLTDNSQERSEVTAPEFGSRQDYSVIKEVTPKVFYGSPIGKPLKRPPQFLRLLHEIHKDLAAEGAPSPRTNLRSRVWATFPRQDEALQFADSHDTKETAVFAYQDHVTGQRRYLATPYEEFWLRYNQMPPKYRHHYEIIRQGSPCHLYFDLEYNRVANKEANGEAMVDLLLSVVSEVLLDVYSLEYKPSWTVELDSTIEEKFSRHLIIHIPKAAFKDNSHAGAFAGEMCSRIDKLRGVYHILNQLYVLRGESRVDCKTQLFVDQAVYSRNRSFRLPFSSKAGKRSQLLPTCRFRCRNMKDHDVFMDSLICKLDRNCERLLTFGTEVASCGESLVVGLGPPFTVTKMPQFGAFCVSGMSPFPGLDRFIESISCIGNIQGRIRSWYWFSEYGVVVYNISGNRYCERIGRHHKSNHVMYIVDFRMAGYYQKCHDPDCKGYKSPLRPIPQHTIPPDFPLSLSVYSECVSHGKQTQEAVSDICDGIEKCSLGRFSSLSIVNSDEKDFVHREVSCMEDACEDSVWWEQVIDSTVEIECKSKLCSLDNQLCNVPSLDENWWKAVEEETEKVEGLKACGHVSTR